MTDLFATLVSVLGRTLLDFVWQGAMIGLLAGMVLVAMRNARPHARYAVGCVALLACALAPLLDIVLLLTSRSDPAVATIKLLSDGAAPGALAMFPAAASWPAQFESRLPLVVALWSAGASLFLLRHAAGVIWIARMRADAHDTGTRRQWQRRLDALARHFDLVRAPVLRLVDGLDSPVSAGWLRPVILLPAALILRMPADQLEALLAHELAHVRRNDYLANLLQSVVESLLFYHPVVWWLSCGVRRERERIADQLAAEVTGSPRTLAIALSALSELPHIHHHAPQTAQAAHGGHLMSRIEQLVRPGRPPAGRFAFPVLGLAAACIAFYAHAQVSAHAAVPATTESADVSTVRTDTRKTEDQPFALVSADRSGVTMSGSVGEIKGIEALRRSMSGDFLWFRRGGKAWVVTDPAVLASVKAAWRETDALDDQMDALDKEMDQYDKVMDALDGQMETLSASTEETPALREASRRMEDLGAQQESLGKQQEQLAEAQANAGEATQDQLDTRMDALSQKMEALSAQMDEQSRVVEAESAKMERNAAPMEALGRKMEDAGKPMEALGARMDALGKRMDALSSQATRETNAIIDEAMAKHLATPAP